MFGFFMKFLPMTFLVRVNKTKSVRVSSLEIKIQYGDVSDDSGIFINSISCRYFGAIETDMNRHQVLTGACNAGDQCYAVGSVEGIHFTVRKSRKSKGGVRFLDCQ